MARFTNSLGKTHKNIQQEAAWWQGTVGTASIHRPLCNAPIMTRLLAQCEEIDILLTRCCTIIFPEISFLKVGLDRSSWLMSLIRSYCLEQLGIFVGASNFTCIGFVNGQRDNMPWDRKFIKKRSPWNLFRLHCCCIPCDNVVMVCCALSAFTIFKNGCWIRNRPHTENRLPQ